MNPATAAARKPHCQPAAATMKPVIIMDTAFPSCGVEENMLYMVPRFESGNQRDRLIVPGGDPMDCIQPFTPQSTAKKTIMSMDPKPSGPSNSPSTPSSRFSTADTPMPTAMKRRMLQ